MMGLGARVGLIVRLAWAGSAAAQGRGATKEQGSSSAVKSS